MSKNGDCQGDICLDTNTFLSAFDLLKFEIAFLIDLLGLVGPRMFCYLSYSESSEMLKLSEHLTIERRGSNLERAGLLAFSEFLAVDHFLRHPAFNVPK